MIRFFDMLWQPIRQFEFTSPVIDELKFKWLAIKPISTIVFGVPRLRQWLTQRNINERIMEIPFVLGHLPHPPANVLDVGACESPISLMLASMGYQVTSLDLRPYPFSHPNLRVVQGDITAINMPVKYDVVICLSTLEHIGLPVYGSREIPGGDFLAIIAIHALLKKKGKLLLTVPAGVTDQFLPKWCIYSPSSLAKLLVRFSSTNIKYGVKLANQQWTIHSHCAPEAVALVEATK